MPIDDDFETPTDETSLMLVREISGFVRAGELDRAEAVIRERLDEQPRFAFGQLLLGIIFAHGKRFDEALEACEAALAIERSLDIGDDIGCDRNRGRTARRRRKYRRAEVRDTLKAEPSTRTGAVVQRSIARPGRW